MGTGITNKQTQTKITRGSTANDVIPVIGVTSITKIGTNGFTEDYVQGVDYILGTGGNANKVVWTTPGTITTGSFQVNNLDFSTLSDAMTVAKTGTVVNDSYVVEVTVSGEGSTKATMVGAAPVANNISVTETIVVTIDGVDFNIALTNGMSRANVLLAFQNSLTSVATVTLVTNVLHIVTVSQGDDATIETTIVSSTLATELGLDTPTYTAGTSGDGQFTVTARSDRSTNVYGAGEVAITDIPGLTLTITTTEDNSVGEKAEIVTLADQIAKNPATGSAYFINVVSTKQVADYELQYFTRDEEEVFYQIFGNPDPANTLSLAAYVAFRNLVDIIAVVQLQGAADLPHFEQAIDKLIDQPIYYVVPLTTDPLVHAYAKFHVNQQSDILQRRERMTFVSGAAGYTPYDHIDSARALNDERVVWVVPSSWQLSYLDTNNESHTITIDGSFGAVATAAIAAVRDPATPLTRKQVIGLVPNVTYSRIQKDLLATNGCLVIETTGAVSRVRHQLTTLANGPIESKEISIVQLRDHLSVVLRNNLEDQFPGTKITRVTPKLVQSYVERILEGLVAQEIIADFQNVRAVQSSVDPTEIDVFVDISAVYPFNYALTTFKFIRQAQVNNL